MRKAIEILLALALIVGFSAACSANDLYFAQSAAGAGNGSSCANARAISALSASVAAGATLHVCGPTTSSITISGSGSASAPAIIDGDGVGSTTGGFTIQGNYITIQNLRWPNGAGVFMAKGTHHLTMRNNWLRNQCNSNDGDIIGSEGSADFVFEGNYAENCATAEVNHDDIIQTWGGSARWVIRYNMFVMNSTQEFNKSFHMLEGIAGPIDIYGNIYLNLRGADGANGINMNSNESSMVAHIYGNTVVQKGGGNNLFNLKGNGSWDLQNNITYVTGVGNALTGDAVGTSRMTRRNNLWFGSGSPSCVATEICGRDPMFTDITNNDFSLRSGSPAIGMGTNLGSTFIKTPTKGAQWPNPTLGNKSSTGSWDLGALLNATVNAPAPPTGLSVIVE